MLRLLASGSYVRRNHRLHSIGRIGPDGTRPANDLVGRQRALEGDFCLCACSPKPTLIASQKDWTLDT